MPQKSILKTLFVLLVFISTENSALSHKIEGKKLTLEEIDSREGWIATNLDLEIDVRKDIPTYKGSMTLRLEAEESEGPVVALNYRNASMELLEIGIKSTQKLPPVNIDRNIPSPGENENTLTLFTFKEPVKKGIEVEIEFSYKFVKEQGQVFNRPIEDYEGWPKLHYGSWVTGWYPYLPDGSESLMSSDGISIPGTTTFIMPKNLNGLSNGKLTKDETEGEIKRQTWTVGKVARSYIAGPFKVSSAKVGKIDVAMYLLNDNPEVVKTQSKQLTELFALQEKSFGDYPFETFALAEIPEHTTGYFAASSEQGFIVAGSTNFTSEVGFSLFSHEAGHAWWGNKFSCSGLGGALCSEAMAQFGTLLSYQAVYGDKAMRDYMEVSAPDNWPAGSMRGYFAMVRQGDDKPLNQVDGWHVHRVANPKGSWFWQMLREKLGDDIFFPILKSLPVRGGRMTLEEIEAYFIEKSGQDLGYFFDQWVKRPGAPILNLDWTVTNKMVTNEYSGRTHESVIAQWDEDPKTLEIYINQEQKDLYNLDLEVEIEYYYKPSVRKSITLSERTKTISIETKGFVKDVILDPDRKVLMWRPQYGPKPNLTD